MFGVNVNPYAAEVEKAFEIARAAENFGLDIIGVQDHPYRAEFMDMWTLMATLSISIKRIRFMPTVADIPLRPPAMLAKAAVTLDILTKGRVELGIGAGAVPEQIQSYGGVSRTPGERVRALEEAIKVMRLIWGSEDRKTVTFHGQFYNLKDAHPGPQPHNPIRVWVGNNAGQRMLELTGRLADGWICPLQSYLPTDKIMNAQTAINESAAANGRSPSSIRRLRLLAGIIDEDGKLEKSLHGKGEAIVGTINDWVNELLWYRNDLGVESFIFWPATEDQLDQIRLFATSVVPKVRNAVKS